MRILWLNWRDIKNPESGGAEVMTHETAKRLVKAGNTVTVFAAKYPRSKNQEVIDNVIIIRKGNRLTCRFWAYLYYKKHFKGKVDFVIDEINTIPFFTNFYVSERKVALIHQLAREYWWSEIFFPINLLGYILEPLYLKLYKSIPTIAASNSTKKDLQKLGFKNVSVFHQGLSIKPSDTLPVKSKEPKILFLGRLTRPKGALDAIQAFSKINKVLSGSKLTIVGKGKPDFTKSLKKMVKKMHLGSKITFRGFVTQKRKIELLQESKIILVPSAREGWNLVPIEANACGCVPIGYNVPGLRDSIGNGQTGVLTRVNTAQDLAQAALSILKDEVRYKKLQQDGLSWSRKFSWDKTYQSVQKVLTSIPYKILWLSWRDIKNPDAGGAEKVATEITSRLVQDGSDVTVFTSNFRNSKSQESHRGVKIIRKGNLLTCRIFALSYYLKNTSFDLIIDEINTLPFFSPLYARKKAIALIHQLAREYWFTQTIWPINMLGYILEPIFLKLYRKIPTIAVSKSTVEDLKKLHFAKINLIREGLDIRPEIVQKKENLILFIGRLTKAKGPQDAILAFKHINKFFPESQLNIIGKGDKNFIHSLKRIAKDLKVDRKIQFTGFVAQRDKILLLKKAKIVLIPSIREGWNLVATEANALGCVPIAYNVAGLRDSIKNYHTGILTLPNPQSLAQVAIKVLKNEQLRKKLAKNGYLFSKNFSWVNTYKDFKQNIPK